jgi:hypothetical protein
MIRAMSHLFLRLMALLACLLWAMPARAQQPDCRRRAIGEFLTGLRSSKGATPAKLFHTSINRCPPQVAASLFSSFAVANACWLSALAGVPAWGAMLFSESIVNVAIVNLSSGRLYLAVITFITLVGAKGKAIRPESGDSFSNGRRRALESPGRTWRYALVVATARSAIGALHPF